MSNGNKRSEVSIVDKLNELPLTPSERAAALGAMRVAEDAVDIVGVVRAALKRVAGFVSLKPSVRA